MRPIAAFLALLLLPVIASATGPLDGSFQVTEHWSSDITETYYLIALQNGVAMGFAVLRSVDGHSVWSYGLGELGVDGLIRGTLFDHANVAYAVIEATISGDGAFLSATVYYFAGSTTTIHGARFF